MKNPSCLTGVIMVALLALCTRTRAQSVLINEVSSASNERMLRWLPDGSPRLGSGVPWHAGQFNDTSWLSGSAPFGWGTSVTTNLQTAMSNKTPSLYLRKTFTVTAAQAALATPVVLQADYDDGFVAWLNGVEIARANAGPAKHFLYSHQPAYNPRATAGLEEFQGPAANSLLVAGTNVLAIQAHNNVITSNFRLNAGLKVLTSTAPITVLKASWNFDNANDAARTHQNSAGTIANTASGSPMAGGWLATASDPVSTAAAGTSISAVTRESIGGGVGGSGGLSYTFTQTGSTPAISVRAPVVSMVNAWTPLALSPATLATTSISFHYRTGGDVQFDFRLDPTPGQAANSTDGFPRLGNSQAGAADYDWATAANGYREMIISGTGSQSVISGGSINVSNYDIVAGAGCRSGTVRALENNTAGSGPQGSTGHFSFRFVAWPTVVDTMAFRINRLTVTEWAPGLISVADWSNTRVSFRWRLPAGRSADVALEPSFGATAANSATIGTLTGTGNWENFAAQVTDLPNGAALRTQSNSTFQRTIKLRAAYNGTSFATGESIDLDTLNLYLENPAGPKEENAPREYSNVAGGYRTIIVDTAGNITGTVTGNPTEAVSLFADPAAQGMQARITEDATAGGGNGGSTGFLRCSLPDPPNMAGAWGFSLPDMQVRNWPAGNIAVANIQDAALQFAAKIPVGTAVQLYAEPPGGSTLTRAYLGSFTGNNTWQIKTVEFAAAGNIEDFRIALNAAGTNRFQLTFVCPSNTGPGDQISVDDIQILTWRAYTATLNKGQNQQRFMDYLNQTGLVQFVPTFTKVTSVPAGASLSLDNVEVTYTGPDPLAAQQLLQVGPASGSWKYFAGLAEPSGGVFDRNLLSGVTVPPGEEDDYDNPQNFRDWIELKNTTNAPISLSNWSLTDDDQLPRKWKFPATATLPANGHLVVMCDNRDETNGIGALLHANFEISASGEKVQVYNDAGQLVDEVSNVPDQDTWHTWARNPADNSFAFSDTATPGAANAGLFAAARVKPPDFFKADGVSSFPGGFHAGPQTLVLRSETPAATIRYTLDGSDPTETSGSLYSGPVNLVAPNDKTGVVVRAAAFFNGWLSSDVKTHTFLIDQNAALKTLPALILSADGGRNFYLPMGIMAINGNTVPDLWAPGGSGTYNIPINRGDAYERLISAEYYYPDGRDGWREDVGIRVSSSPYSRPRLKMSQTQLSPFIRDHTQKASFNLFWRDDYGNSSISHPTIPDTDTREFKQLRIRAGKNDIANPFFLDELGRRLYQKMGWVQSVGGWNSGYINGAFKGLYNTCERIREPMFQFHNRTDASFDVRYIQDQVDGDAVFWNQMQAALNTLAANGSQANYQNAANYVDPVCAADYFLCMVYINMDDWMYSGFCNNYAAWRERSPAGRYRFMGWDLEAAFGRFGKAVNFDTFAWMIATSNEVSNVFRGLNQSPEWKLLFADRIQKHLFNNGILDDRSATAFIKTQKDKYVAEIQPVIRFIENNAGLNLDVGWFNNHVNPTTGRRAYLLGPASTLGTFRQRGLWPVTEPPVFSQHGGIVGANYPLTITSPTGGTIYYTLDGADPRLTGGGVSPSALIYNGTVPLTTLTGVKSRVRSSLGEWSPLTEALFQPGSVAPTTSSLVVSEIMYRPPDPTNAEFGAGFTDGGDFEFIRLTNVASSLLDLRQLAFTAGITFSFAGSTIESLAPGASVLVVKRAAALEFRFGAGIGQIIAGEYAGSLNNGGEQIRLDRGTGNPPVQLFTYDDDPPWPAAPDGFGPSLLLRITGAAPDHNDPANWTYSAQPGGMPGGTARSMDYATWTSLSFPRGDIANTAITGPLADPDADGLLNLDEFALGTPALLADTSRLPVMRIETLAGSRWQTLEFRLHNAITGVTSTPQSSGDMLSWTGGPADINAVSGPMDNGDGTSTWKVRDAQPYDSRQRRFLRLFLTSP